MCVTGIEPHTLWVMTNPAVKQCAKVLSQSDNYKVIVAVHINEFLIVFEKRILVPDMTPEPLFSLVTSEPYKVTVNISLL